MFGETKYLAYTKGQQKYQNKSAMMRSHYPAMMLTGATNWTGRGAERLRQLTYGGAAGTDMNLFGEKNKQRHHSLFTLHPREQTKKQDVGDLLKVKVRCTQTGLMIV